MQIGYLVDFEAIPLGKTFKLNLMLQIKARKLQSDKPRLPLNISVVLDRSGSMAGDKLNHVKKAAQFLIQHLSAQDTFSLVTYNHDVSVDLPARTVENKTRINAAIDKVTAGGTTNLSGGWLQGCQLVTQHLNQQQVNRVLLLTDGLANQGVTDTDRLKSLSREKRDAGITTTTMGVGMDFNEDLLTQMAAEGGGAFYFIDDPDQAPHIFSEELRDLLSVVAQNLVVTFVPSEEVTEYSQLNTYALEETGDKVGYRLGDIYSEEEKQLLIEVEIKTQSTERTFKVGVLKVEFDEIFKESTDHQILEFPVHVSVISPESFADNQANAQVLKTALLLRAARAREEAIKEADRGNFAVAKTLLDVAANDIQSSDLEDQDLQREHDMLREEAVDMTLGSQRYDAYSRKSSTSKVFYTTQRNRRDETVLVHGRLKASRRAIERHGVTPTVIKWKREQLALDSDMIKIGRATDNDIVIPENEVSDYHCQITRIANELIVEDLNSTNGTYCNGGRVEGHFKLSVGDVMTVGSWLFMFDR